MKLKRNYFFHGIARNFTNLYIKTYHDTNILGAEHIPKQGPALIIPKHQSMKDIPLEGYILDKYVKRNGNWIMRPFPAQKFFELIGGIYVIREEDVKKDIKNIENRRSEQGKLQRRSILEKAKQTNDKAVEYMKWLYQNNELVVMHAEGTRNYGAMNPINMTLVDDTNQLRKELGIKIPLILMGIDYENVNKFRSNVNVTIERLDWDTPNLKQAISSGLERLSGL